MQLTRQLDAGKVALANSLIRCALQQKLVVASRELTLAACRLQEEKIQTETLNIKLKVGQNQIGLWLQPDDVKRLFGDVCWSAFDQDVACLFVGDMFAPALQRLGDLFGNRPQVQSVQFVSTGCAPEQAIAATVKLANDQTLTAWLEPAPDLSASLIQRLAVRAPAHGAKHLTLSAHILAGRQSLSANELARIAPGAVVLMRPIAGQNNTAVDLTASIPVTVTAGEQPLFTASLGPSTLSVTSTNLTRNATESVHRMKQQSQHVNGQPDNPPEVSLTFRIGKLNLSLAELQAVAPGYVMQTDINTASPAVDICVGLEAIGHGKLVQVGEQLAVEVTDWGNSDV